MANPFLHEPESSKKSSFFSEVIQSLVVALVFNVVIYFLFIIPSQVDGPSMLPNLVDKELLFANKTASWFSNQPETLAKLGWEYQRGDILIFDFENIVLVKRLIGLPGDKIMITTDGEVFVNGKLLNESYLPQGTKTGLPQGGVRAFAYNEEITVPEDKYYLMGDNRSNSKDSRFADVGFIPRTKVKGVIIYRFFPLNKMGLISRPEYK